MHPRTSFRGRAVELARIDGVLDGARHGMGGMLAMVGVAGNGKSALLDQAAERGGDLQVVRVTGAESEMRMGYAALHQLLRPHLADGWPTLPAPLRRIIEVVFGDREGSRPEPFLVGLATLHLLSQAGRRHSILCLVDDVHWVDRETADVLAFLGRRLLADPVALILAARSGSGWQPPADLPTLRLGGLGDQDALAIVHSTGGAAIDPAVADAIVRQTGGNPLALEEITRGLTDDQRAGRAVLPTPLPVGPKLAQALSRTLALLPERTRAVLLLAAADPTGSTELLWRAASRSGLSRVDLAPAEDAAVIAASESVNFRHPLLRSAAYWAAEPIERRAAHAAIAAAMSGNSDYAMRAWQLAKAANGPEEQVATELEAAGDRSTRTGATFGGALSYRMASDYSVAASARGRRSLKASETFNTIGELASAQEMLDRATADLPDKLPAPTLARVARLRSWILFQQGRPSDAAAVVLDAVRLLAVQNIRTARDMLLEAMAQSLTSERLAPRGTMIRDLTAAAVTFSLPPTVAQTVADILLDAYIAYFTLGLPEAGSAIRGAVDAVVVDPRGGPEMLRWIRAATTASSYLADHEGQWSLARRLLREGRALDDVEAQYRALMVLANLAIVGGQIRQAEALFAELVAIDHSRGRPLTFGRLMVAAWRGEVAQTTALYEAVVDEATQYEQGYLLPRASWAQAIICLATSKYDSAYLALAPYAESSTAMPWALPDTIEAAVRSGRREDAARIFKLLENVADASPQNRLMGYVARCRALLLDQDRVAETYYLQAIRLHQDTTRPAHEARSRLLYGEWLRRIRKRRDARNQLGPAYETFQRLGMAGFAERAASELRLAGAALPAGARPNQIQELSEHEADVARLAASGFTNGQIAGQLFISASTVDYHLRKVFRKLSISSRHELVAIIGNS